MYLLIPGALGGLSLERQRRSPLSKLLCIKKKLRQAMKTTRAYTGEFNCAADASISGFKFQYSCVSTVTEAVNDNTSKSCVLVFSCSINLTGGKISIEITRHFKKDLSDAFERAFHGV